MSFILMWHFFFERGLSVLNLFILTYGLFQAVFSPISANFFSASEISRGKKIDLWVKKFFLSKNVLKPKFRYKTHLQAMKDSSPAIFHILGRFRPIYRIFIFWKKCDFGIFSMWPILAENSAEMAGHMNHGRKCVLQAPEMLFHPPNTSQRHLDQK